MGSPLAAIGAHNESEPSLRENLSYSPRLRIPEKHYDRRDVTLFGSECTRCRARHTGVNLL